MNAIFSKTSSINKVIKEVEENKPLLYGTLLLAGALIFLWGHACGSRTKKEKDELAHTLLNLNLKHENEVLRLKNEVIQYKPIG